MSTHTPAIDRETVTSIVAVLTRLEQAETATDHTDILADGIARVWDCYDGEAFDVSPDDITSSDVETTYHFLDQHGPSREEADAYRAEHGTPHPNRILTHTLDFVDAASRYRYGCLPSFRTWTATYIHDGTVIAERTYDYEDSITLSPVIDDVRYRSTATKRDDDGTVRVHLSERPFRTDIDLYIHHATAQSVKVEGLNGPNVATETNPISTLGEAFDQEIGAEPEAIVAEELDDVIDFIEQQGWEYEADDDVQLPE